MTRFQIHQRDGIAHILGLEHHLVWLGTHFRAFGRPREHTVACPHRGKRRRMRHFTQGPAHGRQRHAIAIRIRGKHVEGDRFARKHAGVAHGRDLRRLVGTQLHVDLEVARDLAHLAQGAAHFSPLFDANGHVVFPGDLGGVPCDVARVFVNAEHIGCRAHFIWVDVRRDELTPKPAAGHQAVRQHIAVGIVGRWVVNPRLVQARIFGGGIQQLHAVVVPRLGVDDEQRLDGKGRVDRPRHVQHPFVSVGVFHGQRVNAWPPVGVRAAIDVFLDVSGHHDDGQLPGQTVELVSHFIPPRQKQPRPICQCTGFGVGGDDHLVGQTLHVGVGNFAGTVVGRLGQIRRHEAGQQHAKPCENATAGHERKDDLGHGKTKVLVATFDLTP